MGGSRGVSPSEVVLHGSLIVCLVDLGFHLEIFDYYRFTRVSNRGLFPRGFQSEVMLRTRLSDKPLLEQRCLPMQLKRPRCARRTTEQEPAAVEHPKDVNKGKHINVIPLRTFDLNAHPRIKECTQVLDLDGDTHHHVISLGTQPQDTFMYVANNDNDLNNNFLDVGFGKDEFHENEDGSENC
uniref:Uncharacterized protein n=1 Tax=Tanacetum cinerariifolium TaxID=118510 RepID=A0A6L2NCT7_TANCI|nr:hypothetical protein [Tanacetum cinerariifolium]